MRCKDGWLAIVTNCPSGLVSSSGKYFSTHNSGFGAAWPRPQIEASRISVRKLGQQRRVPRALLHQLDGLLGADPAGRALAAALVLEEPHQVERHRLHVVLVGQDHNRVRADEAAVFLQRAEIERHVGHRRRQDAARGAARQIALEGVAVRHAAAIFLDQLARGDAGRRQLHARLLHAAGDREAAQALALVAAVRGEPRRALLDDVAHPEQRLDVLLERRAAEQADLRHIGRAVARQPALALDRFDHRGFFAADVGAGAAAQMQLGVLGEARPARPCAISSASISRSFGIFVADVDVDVGRLDHPGGDQHAFDEAVRIALEIVAVLEGAGLALVGVDRHQPRRRLGAHQRPFAPGRKAGAAEAAQAGVAHDLDHLVARALAGEAIAAAARSRRRAR